MPSGEPLIVTMAGVRMGDRLLIIGADVPKGVAELARKPGLTGRTCIVDEDTPLVQRAGALAESEGALVEYESAPVTTLPYESGTFDVVVVNHLLTRLDAARRATCVGEAARVVRGGGRCMVVQRSQRHGVARLLSASGNMAAADIESLLHDAGFRAVHLLAERDGVIYIEGAKGSVSG